MATTSMSVFRNLDCLSLVVCSNTYFTETSNCVFISFQILHFQIGGAAYLWMRLIHGRLRYYKLDDTSRQNISSSFSQVHGFESWNELKQTLLY